MLHKFDELTNNRLKDSGQRAGGSSQDNATFARTKKVHLGRELWRVYVLPITMAIEAAWRAGRAEASRSWPFSNSVERAMAAGGLLIEAKGQLNGQWPPCLRDHCEISERTAQLYMHCAKSRAEIEKRTKSATVADSTLNEAAAVLMQSSEAQKLFDFVESSKTFNAEQTVQAAIDRRVALLGVIVDPDAGILQSLLLQYGCPIEVIAKALSRNSFGKRLRRGWRRSRSDHGAQMTDDPAIERRLLKLLFEKAQQFADAVRMGQLGFLDAVYLIVQAARDSGLADGISDARLQRCIGTAFMGALPKASPSTTTTTLMAPGRGTPT